jgi:chorismate mutase
MQISDWRLKIDDIDITILNLLNKRAEYALQIAKLKKSSGKSVYDAQREEEALSNIIIKNSGPLPDLCVKDLFRKIITCCRNLEEDI